MANRVLNLEDNEYVVYQREDDYVLFNEEEVELYITNLNLILFNETNRMFKKSTIEITKWPINDIKLIDNVPQITIEFDGDNSYWNIVILFNNGLKKFGVYVGSKFKKNEVKKEVESLVEKITQLRSKGTIILKHGKTERDEDDEKLTESKSNVFNKTVIGKKITGGINYIKETVKLQGKDKKESTKDSKSDQVEVKTVEPIEQKSTDNEFNFCQNCGEKKHKDAKFCPSCGAPQFHSELPKEKTVEQIYLSMNEEQKLMVEILVDFARNKMTDPSEIHSYMKGINPGNSTNGKTIQEIFDSLSEQQQRAVYTIIGAEVEEVENAHANQYIIRFHTVINRTNIIVNGILVKQLDKNQYYDFIAELNVKYDIELSTVILISVVSKKNISICEKTPHINKWIGFGTAGNLAIEDFDMSLEDDRNMWERERPKDKRIY